VEFARLEKEVDAQDVHENESDVQVVLATGVKLQSCLASEVANTSKCVRFEAVIKDGVTAEAVDDSTMCDIIIISTDSSRD
jgi:hypothetical protein